MAPLLASSFFAVALLYSSVGHGGGSAYLAILALVGLSPDVIKPTALWLNIIVSANGFFNYYRAGHFSKKLLLPFVLTSFPAAFLGGLVKLSPRVFSALLALALLAAALRLLFFQKAIQPRQGMSQRRIFQISLPLGFVLGLLAGLVGVGGGIFLSPLLLFLGWADAKKTAAVSSAFILLNSASGLLAHSLREAPDWELLLPLALVVFIGGQLGSRLGAYRIQPVLLQQLLGLVLLIAAMKLALSAL